MHWVLAGYMWLFIHRPFEVWPWLGDLHVERVYMLIAIGAWLLSENKGWTRNRLNAAFAAFFAAVVLAWVASPYMNTGQPVVEELFKVGVFYVLSMSVIRDERKLRFLIVAFLVCMALYMGHSLREYLNGRHEYRMGTARMVGVDTTYNDPNTFAASLLYALPLTLPLWREAATWKRKLPLVGYVALTCMCILLTGSRTALVGLFALLAIAVAVSRYRFRIVVALVVLAPLVWKSLPEDRQNRYLTIWDPSYGPVNAVDSAESRAVFLGMAYDLWKQQPVFGFGPASFSLASNQPLQVHSLYGQLLAEVGLAGMVTFAFILYGFVANWRDTRRYNAGVPWRLRPFSYWLSTSVIVSVVLLMILGFAGHNLYRYTWLWYGAFQAIALGVARRERAYSRDIEPEPEPLASDSVPQAVAMPCVATCQI